jgi:hypothetical protein
MDISAQSVAEVDVQIRGSPFVMESLGPGRLVANFDLRGVGPGAHSLPVTPEVLGLPPGIRLERASPRAVSVRLAPRQR